MTRTKLSIEKPSTPVLDLKGLPKTVQTALRDLPPKQQLFVMAYCGEARGNGSLAARLAGYTQAASGFQSWQLLTMPQVRVAIDTWMDEFAMSAAELTARIADLALANPGPFAEVIEEVVGKGKNAKTTRVLRYDITPENWARYQHWVRAIEVDGRTGRVTKLLLHDAQRAMETLAKIRKLFNDAPQINLMVYLEKLSDEDLLKQLDEARAALRTTALGAS